MRSLIKILIALAIVLSALFFAPILVGEKGYVLIAMGSWTIELTVVSLVFILICVAIVSYLSFRLLKVGTRSAGNFGSWFTGRSRRIKELSFYDGLYALALGKQDAAQTAMQKAQGDSYHGFNYVSLGQLALQNNKTEEAVKWFTLAKQHSDPRSQKASAILLAQHHIFKQEPEQALAELADFESSVDPDVLNVRAQALALAKDWQTLELKLPGWKKPLGKNYDNWTQQLSNQQFADIASKQGANQLKSHWNDLPRYQRNHEARRLAFISQLLHQGMHADAQDYLVKWYKGKALPKAFLSPIKRLRLPNPAATIALLEQAIKQQPDDADFYAALGHVAYYSNDLRLSERALAKAITLVETKSELMLLADIYQQNKAFDEAIQAMRRVVEL